MRVGVVGTMAAVVLMVPASASAATVTMTADAGPAASTYVLFRAAPGEGNRVTVRLRKEKVVIADDGVARLRFHDAGFGRCDRLGPRRLACPRAPVVALLRDRADTFRATPGGHGHDHARRHPLALQKDYTDTEGAIVETTVVSAGPGDDIVQGSRGFDSIYPGAGSDLVRGRGGGDTIYADTDRDHDRLSGGPGIDALDYGAATRPVSVDLRAGFAFVPGPHLHRETIAGFERVHGGPKGDSLRGSDTGDALYGEGGDDVLEGRLGNDLLVGDSPIATEHFPNVVFAGKGSDVIDARGYAQAPAPSNAHLTSTIRCGDGHDRELGETDDRLGHSCEESVLELQSGSSDPEPLYRVTATVWPVEQAADGSPTYEIECPARPGAGCAGVILLEAPPPAGQGPDVLYGSGEFGGLAPGERRKVPVTLNAQGRQAVAAGEPIDVTVKEDVDSGSESPGWTGYYRWEQVLGSG